MSKEAFGEEDDVFAKGLRQVQESAVESAKQMRVSFQLDRFLGEDRDIDPEGKAKIISIARSVLEGASFDEEAMTFVLGNVEFSFLLPAFMVSLGLPPDSIPKWSVTIEDETASKRSIAAFRYAQARMRDYALVEPEVRWRWLAVALRGFRLETLKGTHDLAPFLTLSLPTMLMEAKFQYGKQRFAPYLEAFALALELNYEGRFGIEQHYGKLKPSRLVINNTVFEGGRGVNHSRAIEPLASILAQPVPVKGKQTSSVPLILTDEFWQVVEDFKLPITSEIKEIDWPRYFYL